MTPRLSGIPKEVLVTNVKGTKPDCRIIHPVDIYVKVG